MVDANTVVSAALNPNGLPRQAIAIARSQGTIALSEAVYEEIAGVMARPKFARTISEDRRNEILELLAAAALWVQPREPVDDCRDAKDNRYLELGLAANASAIVSGDTDLLVLDPWRGIRIVPPARFLVMVRGDKP